MEHNMAERASMVIEVSEGGAGGSNQVARDVDGDIIWVEITPEEQKAYTPPPDGLYSLMVTGVYETWEKDKPIEWVKPGGKTKDTKTRIEFEILEGKGKGKRFASVVNVSLHEKASMYPLWKATVGTVSKQPDLTEMIGHKLKMYINRKDDVDANGNPRQFANPEWSTAKPMTATADDDGWES